MSLTNKLDRRGTRRALAAYVSIQARRKHGERVHARYDKDGFWIVEWPTARVPEPQPSHSPTVRQMEEVAADVFLQEYRPSRGDVVIDAGAGVGWELGLWSRLVGTAGRVVAIEADPATFAWLERRRRLNE